MAGQLEDKQSPVIYWIVRSSCHLVFMLFFRLSCRGAEKIPLTGPVLVVANHSSNMDPPLVAVASSRRRLRFLAKKELWKNRFLGWLITQLGAIPVDRESAGDRQAITTAIEILKRGEALLVFPEGTRSEDGTIHEFQAGSARLAGMVPGTRIVPLRLRGTFEAWGKGKAFPRPRRVTVRVGEPFDANDLPDPPKEKKSLYRALTDEMFARISNL